MNQLFTIDGKKLFRRITKLTMVLMRLIRGKLFLRENILRKHFEMRKTNRTEDDSLTLLIRKRDEKSWENFLAKVP